MAKIRDERSLECTTYDSIELLNTPSSVIDGSHSDETEPSGAIGLLERGRQQLDHLGVFETDALIIHNSDFFYSTETTEFFVEVTLLSAYTETENTQNIGWIWGLWGDR